MKLLRYFGNLFLTVLICLTTLTPTFLPASATKGSYPGKNGLIAFNSFDGNDQELFTMNGDGTGVTQLTSNSVHYIQPCWSPDGQWIAFVRGPTATIWVIRANGTYPRQLTLPPIGCSDYDPAWSPDGKTILFTRYTGDPSHKGDIYRIDADYTGPGELLIENARTPSWSPDESMIAYLNTTDSNIWVADSSTGAPLFRVTSDGGINPCWSPDGRRIVYDLAGNIYVIGVDGSNKQLVASGGCEEPNWSPDGTKIIFHRTPVSIWIMNPDGSNAYDLTPSMPGAQYPDWQTIPIPEPPIGGEVLPGILNSTGTWITAAVSTIALTMGILHKKRKTS